VAESAEAESMSKEKRYNGHTISEIKSFIRSTDPIAKVVDSLLKKLFTTNEILNCSITGKRSTKSNDEGPRPAFDQERFNVTGLPLHSTRGNFVLDQSALLFTFLP
jgi:hypothetical protein